eukprot:4810310-Pyramimonas_sp.AAC.1
MIEAWTLDRLNISCPDTPVLKRSTHRAQNVRVHTLRIGSALVGPCFGERIALDLRLQSACAAPCQDAARSRIVRVNNFPRPLLHPRRFGPSLLASP